MAGPSTCEMQTSVWRELPTDMLQEVLAHLPISSLCRFQAVTKNWKQWIHDPVFAAKHARIASKESLDAIAFIASRNDEDYNDHHPIPHPMGWTMFDIANRRFLTLNDDFLTKFAEQEIGIEILHKAFRDRITVAADEGIFCIAYTGRTDPATVLLACNPVLKTLKLLPADNYHVRHSEAVENYHVGYSKAVMHTDRLSGEYEIYVFHVPTPTIHIYDSKTSQWRPPVNIPKQFEIFISVATSVFFKDQLCSLCIRSHRPQKKLGIFIYDRLTNICFDSGVDLYCDFQEFVMKHLLVSGDPPRLYYVTIKGEPVRSLEIYEIILAETKYELRAKMPNCFLRQILDPIVDVFVVGCAKSHGIIIWCPTGLTVMYNFASKNWDQLPDNNLIHRNMWEIRCSYEWTLCAGNNCLSLCPP